MNESDLWGLVRNAIDAGYDPDDGVTFDPDAAADAIAAALRRVLARLEASAELAAALERACGWCPRCEGKGEAYDSINPAGWLKMPAGHVVATFGNTPCPDCSELRELARRAKGDQP